MKVARKSIPWSIRLEVISRQSLEVGIEISERRDGDTLTEHVQRLIRRRFDDAAVELHHRPALVNRPWNARTKDYDPPANSAEHLIYLREEDHGIETRVRGQNGQHSDLGLRRKLKNIAKNRTPGRRKAKIAQRINPWQKGRGFNGGKNR